MLPDLDGFEVYRRLAEGSDRLPVLFLTARDTTDDRVHGLTLGADDYVGKPFSLEELVARVRAVLRRTRRAAQEASVLRFEDLELDEDAREVRRGGREIELTPTEFNLLHYLLANAGRVAVQGPDPRPRVALRLRRRLQRGRDLHQLPAQEGRRRRESTPLIQTVRGFGYAIRDPRGAVRLPGASAAVAADPPDRDHRPAGGGGPGRGRRWPPTSYTRVVPGRPGRPAAGRGRSSGPGALLGDSRRRTRFESAFPSGSFVAVVGPRGRVPIRRYQADRQHRSENLARTARRVLQRRRIPTVLRDGAAPVSGGTSSRGHASWSASRCAT